MYDFKNKLPWARNIPNCKYNSQIDKRCPHSFVIVAVFDLLTTKADIICEGNMIDGVDYADKFLEAKVLLNVAGIGWLINGSYSLNKDGSYELQTFEARYPSHLSFEINNLQFEDAEMQREYDAIMSISMEFYNEFSFEWVEFMLTTLKKEKAEDNFDFDFSKLD